MLGNEGIRKKRQLHLRLDRKADIFERSLFVLIQRSGSERVDYH